MNRKGQTLIIFVILIPIIITMFAVVVDVGLLTHEYLKAQGIIDNGITDALEKQDDSLVEKILKQNDFAVDKLHVISKENEIEVTLEYQIDSLFGKIINIQNYPIKIHRFGSKKEGKIIINKKE